jgi:hypothetical protein
MIAQAEARLIIIRHPPLENQVQNRRKPAKSYENSFVNAQ